jgi:4-diphosphocytidyl-2-C-methyl-D-erythritol kinase
MEETAYAKINLSLKVLGRRSDGYHELDTIFAFAEDGDRLSVEPAEGLSLKVVGPFADAVPAGPDNLVLRAASMLRSWRGAALTLDKRLPVAAGIGGGSADAAAALRLLVRFWGLTRSTSLYDLAGALGADVPACLLSRTARGTGRGDILTPLDLDLPERALLLVNPGVPLSTAEVFGLWNGASGGGANDLEAAARRLAPEIGDVLDALAPAPRSGLSGSGATCFALFEDEAARDRLAATLPARWWRLASRLR